MLYRLLIVLATLIWGSSFVIVKDITDYLDPAALLLVRFGTAAIILALVFLGKRELYLKREYVLTGLLFGAVLFSAYFVQTVGVMYTTPGKNAFLTGTYCVMVPFLAWAAFKSKPTAFNLLAAVLCIVGVGLISLGNESGVNVGDMLTLLCALLYAVHILLVSHLSKGRDIFVLTMWQFAGAALCALVVSLVTGADFGAFGELGIGQWGSLGYLAIFCTTIALLLQNVGQANLPPASASLLLSLESPFGVLFSVLLGADTLSLQLVAGFVLVFASILISEWLPDFLVGRRQEAAV